MKKSNVFTIILAVGLSVAVTTYISSRIKSNVTVVNQEAPSTVRYVSNGTVGAADFTYAAEKTVNAVVHVKTSYTRTTQVAPRTLFDFFYGHPEYREERTPSQGAGSGVILSKDGYIVTNNHVIDKAEVIEVALNDKRIVKAKLVGADPSTDIAVLKIEGGSYDYVEFGSSDNLRIGEWVLAVGNPLNLTSTVTAGIVSAKARNINILSDNFKIESFIQTDAAVNPGNSGGALVNTSGELVGINTAIASPTGSFAGYSFAVPSSIVKKVVADLIEFGVVQRAVLGVSLTELTSETAKELKLDNTKGVLVAGLLKAGSAEEAGLEVNDVIQKVNDIEVNSVAQLQEQISKFRPNDQVSLTIRRNNKIVYKNVVLRNRSGNTSVVTKNEGSNSFMGATLQAISDQAKRQLRIANGVQITDLKEGKLQAQGIKKGYIIVRINRTPVQTVADVENIMSNVEGEAILIEGTYPNGARAYYAIPLQ